MHKSNKQLFLAVLIVLLSLAVTSANVVAKPSAVGVSPTLGVLYDFSVLGGAAVTNSGDTSLTGKVGVSPGTSITGFPPGTADGGIHANDQTAIDAQAEALTVFGALDQTCDVVLGVGIVQLGGRTLEPGVYCGGTFELSGTLTLTGGAEDVYIFKSATTLITAAGSEVVGGDPCHVWWRVGSNATLGTNSSFIGNVVSAGASTSAMTNGAALNGRFIGLSPVTITLDTNSISGPICLAQEPTPTATSTSTLTPTATSTSTPTATVEPTEAAQTAIAATQTATVQAVTQTAQAATQTAQAATQTIIAPTLTAQAATETAIAATQIATLQAATQTAQAATQTAASTQIRTATPGLLPSTGGDHAGLGSQIIPLSLGALSMVLILFGFMLSRRTQKAGR